MRVLYFSRDYTPHDHRFLSALAKTEHEIYYLRLERRRQVVENRALPVEVRQVHWAGGKDTVRLNDGYRLLGSLRQVLRKIKPDVVHAGPIQTAAFLSALSGFKRLVSMSWGYDLLHDVDLGWQWRWSARYTLKHSAVLVADCDTVRQQAEKYGMNPDRIITFPWGVDLEHFSPRLAPNAADTPVTILSTRSWEPLYGVDILAEAFVQAAKIQPNLRLVMIGQGSLAGRLRQAFERGGVAERVTFPGQVSQVDLPRFYHAAELYVSASHTDGSSISLLEALACGLPALVSDIPGNREWVEQGVQGWLFPDGDKDALAQAILRAYDQRNSLVNMGVSARLLAKERADWKQNFPRLLQAYDRAYRLKI
jgi:L-malate glycosyltransferase